MNLENIKQWRNSKGITLISLVITIIILLILAGITISTLTGNDGLIGKAGKAKEKTEISSEKEIVEISAVQALGEDRYGDLIESKLQNQLDINSNNQAKIIDSDSESIIIKFLGSQRYYEVDKDGNVEYINASKEKSLTVQCINSKKEVLAEHTYTIIKDKYSKKVPEVSEYIAAEEKIEGTMSEDNTTIQVLYYLNCHDDKTLLFTGLNSKGNITTNESEIESYMVGSGNNTQMANAFKNDSDKLIESIINIPETYNGKPVIKIGTNAFSLTDYSIKEINLTENIITIESHAFFACRSIKEITIGKNVTSIGHESFFMCNSLEKVIFKNNMTSYPLCFVACDSWTKTEIDNQNLTYAVEDNILYSKDKKTIIKIPTARKEEFVIPDYVERIEMNSFYGSQVESLIINSNLTSIGSGAFGSALIKSIEIGENVEEIGRLAFWNCKNLKTVIINSASVARRITEKENSSGKSSSAQGLVNYAETIYIRNDISEIGSYILENYTLESESDKKGYKKYVLSHAET